MSLPGAIITLGDSPSVGMLARRCHDLGPVVPVEYDAIVVGAGPAGSAAAYYLARAGHHVLVLDRHTFPRHKVCGDCITPRGTRVLRDMGVLDRLDGQAFTTIGCRIYSSKGGCLTASFGPFKDYPDTGVVIARDDLDALLVRHAIDAGAEFVGAAHVTGLVRDEGRTGGHRGEAGLVGVAYDTPEGSHTAQGRYVVAADGGHSRIAREAFGYTSKDARAVGVAFRAYFEDVDGIDDHMEIYGEDIVLPGVGWLFPMGDGRANVGVGIYSADYKRRGLTKDEFLRRFIEDSIHAGPKLARARQVGPVRSAKLLMGGFRGPVVKDRVLLAGDAAALINPLTGEGVMYALESGKWAGKAISQALASHGRAGLALRAYQDAISSSYGRYFSLGCRLIHVAKRPVAVNPGVRLLTKSDSLGRANLRFWISMF